MSTYEMWSDSTNDIPSWTLTTNAPGPVVEYAPASYSRQARRFRAQIARRRGRLLALEVALAMKGEGV